MKGFDYSKDNMYYITVCVHDRICCFGEISVGTGRDLSLSKNVNSIMIWTGHDLSKPSERQIMVLNDYGKLAWKQWHWLAEQYPYVILHAFVEMPNHVHGIIEINRDFLVGTGRDLSLSKNVDRIMFESGRDLSPSENVIHNIMGTGHDLGKFGNATPNIKGTGHDLGKFGNATPNIKGTGHDLSLREQPVKIKSLSEIIGAYKTTVSKQIHLLGYNKFAWQRSFHDHIIRDERSYINITEYIFANPSKWDSDQWYNHLY